MATQIVMNQRGDSRYNFDAKEAKALAKAERRFKDSRAWALRRQSVQVRERSLSSGSLIQPQKKPCLFLALLAVSRGGDVRGAA